MRYRINQGQIDFDAGLGYSGPQYRAGCVAPAIMPVLPSQGPACAQAWPPNSPCAPWPPPGTPYYGRPDQPPPPGTILC